MISAANLTARLLEDGDDDAIGRADIHRLGDVGGEFDAAADDILQDARVLYKRIALDGVISILNKEQRKQGRLDYEPTCFAQAIIRRAIEKRGSAGAANVYKRLKRISWDTF